MATRVYRPGLLADHSSSPTYAPGSPFHRDSSVAASPIATHNQYTVNTASYPASETRSTISRSSTDGITASLEETLHDSTQGSPTNST
ncbi:hypothetical protein H4R34_005639, partial [Dimargaris verticillata]